MPVNRPPLNPVAAPKTAPVNVAPVKFKPLNPDEATNVVPVNVEPEKPRPVVTTGPAKYEVPVPRTVAFPVVDTSPKLVMVGIF